LVPRVRFILALGHLNGTACPISITARDTEFRCSYGPLFLHGVDDISSGGFPDLVGLETSTECDSSDDSQYPLGLHFDYVLPILDHTTDREDPFKSMHASSRHSVAIRSFGAVKRLQTAAQQARFGDRDGLEAVAASIRQ
jgi:hypothetical protein